MRSLPRRDHRGRFMATPMLRVGAHRIGVHIGARSNAARSRRTHIVAFMRFVVALFSPTALARSWGAP